MAEEQNSQTLDYARSLNQEYQNQNKNLDEQIENLQKINASWDKIAQLQAQRMQNIVKQSELMGTMSDELRAYADISAQVNQKNADFIKLRENGLSTATEYLTDILQKKEAEQKIEKRLAKLKEESHKREVELLQETEALKVAKNELDEKAAALAEELGTTVEEVLEVYKEELAIEIENYETQKKITAEKRKQGLLADQEIEDINKVKAANDEAYKNFKSGMIMKGIEKAGDFGRAATDAYGKVNSIASEMYKTTGGNIKLMDNIQANFQDGSILGMASMGIGFENISEAMVNLNQKSGAFAIASAEVQKEVGMVATKLERLGVSAETSGDLFDTLRLNFGFSASEFDDMADTFVGRASDIGMSVQQYTQDFQASYPVLSRYGTDAVNVFDKLARQARASGLSVQELAQSMGQFDTFQGAAENASKLNFLLGSQLDTTQLLMADESERLDMIKSAFSPAQFQNMDKFKKKAIAAAAGFSDVGAFEKAMRGDVEGLGDLAKSNQEKLDDAVVKSTSAQEAMSKAIENSKDQMVLAMGKMSEQLGVKGQTMYGSALAASTALQNFASVAKLATAAQAIPGGAGGMLKGGLSKVGGLARGAQAATAGLGGTGLGMGSLLAPLAAAGAVTAGISGVGEMAGDALKDAGFESAGKGVDVLSDVAAFTAGGAMIGGPVGAAIGAVAGVGYTMWENRDELFGDGAKEELTKEQSKQNDKVDRLIELTEESNKINERTAKAQEKQERFNQEKKNFAHVVSGIDSRKGIRGS